jgi:hypothetical protein
MKILIIAHARSGSSNLLRALVNVLDSKKYGEPFAKRRGEQAIADSYKNIDLENKCVVKTFMEHIPTDEASFNFYIKYPNKFDVVILLIRKNKTETAVSLLNGRKTNKWSSPYTNTITNVSKRILTKLIFKSTEIEDVSNELGIPITYYENLYSGDIDIFTKEMKKIGLDKYTDELFPYFNPKNRLRQVSKTII